MTIDEINNIVDNSFLTHDSRYREFKIYIKPSPDGTKYTDYVKFTADYTESLWELMARAGEYQVVFLEWLVNVHELDTAKRRAKWELERISLTTVDW